MRVGRGWAVRVIKKRKEQRSIAIAVYSVLKKLVKACSNVCSTLEGIQDNRLLHSS